MEIAFATLDSLAALDPASVSILPHCWAQYNSVHCQTPSPSSPITALQAGWTVLQVTLSPLSAYPPAFGTTLCVPICPAHKTDAMIDAALWAFGLHTPLWDTAIPAHRFPDPHIHIVRQCLECRQSIDATWQPGQPLPDGWHAAYTESPGSLYHSHLTVTCAAHAYALWDFSLGH